HNRLLMAEQQWINLVQTARKPGRASEAHLPLEEIDIRIGGEVDHARASDPANRSPVSDAISMMLAGMWPTFLRPRAGRRVRISVTSASAVHPGTAFPICFLTCLSVPMKWYVRG